MYMYIFINSYQSSYISVTLPSLSPEKLQRKRKKRSNLRTCIFIPKFSSTMSVCQNKADRQTHETSTIYNPHCTVRRVNNNPTCSLSVFALSGSAAVLGYPECGLDINPQTARVSVQHLQEGSGGGGEARVGEILESQSINSRHCPVHSVATEEVEIENVLQVQRMQDQGSMST